MITAVHKPYKVLDIPGKGLVIIRSKATKPSEIVYWRHLWTHQKGVNIFLTRLATDPFKPNGPSIPNKWANPYMEFIRSTKDKDVYQAHFASREMYKLWIHKPQQLHLRRSLYELYGCTLGCCCPDVGKGLGWEAPCHGEVLRDMARRQVEGGEFIE